MALREIGEIGIRSAANIKCYWMNPEATAETLSPDGIRSPDPGFQHAVEERLSHEVSERGLSVLRLDAEARPDWLDTVERTAWERLRPAQLPLPSL